MEWSVTESVLTDDLRTVLKEYFEDLQVAVVRNEVDRLREGIRELAGAVLLFRVLIALKNVLENLGHASLGCQLYWPHFLVIADFALNVEVCSVV